MCNVFLFKCEINLKKKIFLWKVLTRQIYSWMLTKRDLKCHGRRIKFWHDVWCGDVPLKEETFLFLFSLATSKEAWLDDLQRVEGRMVSWGVSLEGIHVRKKQWSSRLDGLKWSKVRNSRWSPFTLPWS